MHPLHGLTAPMTCATISAVATSDLARAAALLGVDAQTEPNMPRVVAWERSTGVALPAMLRSFFASEVAEALRSANTQDDVVSLQDLEVVTAGPWLGPDGRAVTLMVENQSVVRWVVPLGMGDDPPVLLIDDDLSELPDHAPVSASPSVASFLRCTAWDVRVLLSRDRPSPIWMHTEAPNQPQFDVLASQFDRVGSTHGWPCRSTHRFERDGKRILLWDCDDRCDWHLDADTEHQLGELLAALDEAGALPSGPLGDEHRQRLLRGWTTEQRS